jgi:uncharacterized tellurite resistance protein B-like protein
MTNLASLTRRERLQLMKFACAAVWADLDVNRSEKSYILSLALRLGLSNAETEQVRGWLEAPPPPEEVDPAQIPLEHRRLFLEAIEDVVAADRVIDGPELESLRLLRELLRD